MTVVLTPAQAKALMSAAYEVEAGYDPDLWPAPKRQALRRAVEALAAELPAKDWTR